MGAVKKLVKGKFLKWFLSAFAGVLAVALLLLLAIGVVASALAENESKEADKAGLPAAVEAHRATVSEIAAEYGMSAYVPLILAIMAHESGGEGADPMNASLFSYNTVHPKEVGGIKDAEYSIRCGVQQLRDLVDEATGSTENPRPLAELETLKLAIQGYNFGIEYIPWAKEKGGYTQENAKEYSDMKAAENGTTSFGDSYYVPLVLRFYITGGGTPGEPGDGIAHGTFLWPVPGHPLGGGYGAGHRGIDIPAAEGTPILACDGGTVAVSEWHVHERSWGWYVLIDHGNGYTTRYAHMCEQGIPTGTVVSAGQQIGRVGNTGFSFGNHLHLEITRGGALINPMEVLNGP